MGTPTLVLLHGALGDRTQLEAIAARLGDDRPILRLEFEGHGASPLRDRSLRMESLATAVMEAMDAANAERADFFGYSMGGYVALYLAATVPERVERVATLATKLAWSPELAAHECAMLDASTIRAKVPRFAAALEARHTGAGWERLLAETAGLLRALGDRPLLTTERLASIACPVRIAVGDRDATVTIDECSAAVRALQNGELEVHPRTAHPFERAPIDRVVRSLSDFLTR